MDTTTTAPPAATGGNRDTRQPLRLLLADGRQAANGKRQAEPPAAATDKRQATGAPGNRWTRAEAAAELGVSVSALRRLQQRADVPGEAAPRDGGGTVVILSDADLAALRAASAAGDTRQARQATSDRRPASGERQPTSAATGRRQAAGGDSSDPAGDGWREALAESRATAARLESELRQARHGEQLAREAADHAENRAAAAETHLAALRVVVWRWYAQASRVGWWRRLRGKLPEPPAELMADKLLAAPRD